MILVLAHFQNFLLLYIINKTIIIYIYIFAVYL